MELEIYTLFVLIALSIIFAIWLLYAIIMDTIKCIKEEYKKTEEQRMVGYGIKFRRNALKHNFNRQKV